MEDEVLERLEAARGMADPLKRRLWVVAVLADALEAYGVRPILVGGGALEFYTFGGYATADVDLVASDRRRLGQLLEGLEFERSGRYWYREDLDLLIECPDEDLAGDPGRVLEVEVGGLICPVIGVEDLIVDRLNGYVHWKWEDDGRWVRQLIATHREDLDLSYLRDRTRAERTAEVFEEILRAADETGCV